MNEVLADILPGDVTLTNCDREPIHIPGSIQPHGFLLGLRIDEHQDFRVVIASQNTTDYLQRPMEQVLNSRPGDLLPVDIETLLLRHLKSQGSSSDLARFIGAISLPLKSGGDAEFQIICHGVTGIYVLEFERTGESSSQGDLNAAITNYVSTMDKASSSLELCQAITHEIRVLTGFDRVMLYQFDEVGHGTVLAEDRNDNLPSYLGLRFPSTDIPRQARTLYVSNRIRIIPNADYEPSPLISIPELAGAPPLDLSLSILRSVSPVHLDYMRNMRTASSMSVSIVSAGRLWGLISAHNSRPRRVSYLVRSACDVLSRILSAQLTASQNAVEFAHALRLKSIQGQLLAFMASAESYIEGLIRHPAELCSVAGASGAAIVMEQRCVLLGDTPEEAAVIKLSNALASATREDVFSTSQATANFPGHDELIAKASGVLAISLSQVHRMQILWFRPEVITAVSWAGEPTKGQQIRNGLLEIHPRNSFASWKQIARQGRALVYR